MTAGSTTVVSSNNYFHGARIAAWKCCINFSVKGKQTCLWASAFGAQLLLALPRSRDWNPQVWVTSGSTTASSSHLKNCRRPPVTQSNLLLHHINVPVYLVYYTASRPQAQALYTKAMLCGDHFHLQPTLTDVYTTAATSNRHKSIRSTTESLK